ncbi:MAG: inositol monophosphatase family protein [Candidatus Levyibacteriota bacterium]
MELSKDFLLDLQNATVVLVQEVGAYVYEEWLKEHSISFKDARDIATEVDVEAEKRLRKGLHKLYPEAGFIVEEGNDARKITFNWIIDPLDQTKKYVAKLPLFYIQLGLLDAKGECILGHIYNPVSKQLFSASRGNGAYLNGKKFLSPARETFEKSIVDINFSGNTDLDWKLKKLSHLARNFYRIQISSNAFSVYILTGAVDCFVALADLKDPVDILPRVIIMKEAGLQVEYLEIEGKKVWIVANPNLYNKIISLFGEE